MVSQHLLLLLVFIGAAFYVYLLALLQLQHYALPPTSYAHIPHLQHDPYLDGGVSSSSTARTGDRPHPAPTAIGTLLRNHPKILNICNLQTLEFDETKMIGKKERPGLEIFNHTSKLAYGPKITKTGSTSAVILLRKALNATHQDKFNKYSQRNEFENLGQYTFFGFVRHPMERFLAGFHQVEVFWTMEWFNGDIKRHGLQWWNQSCLPMPTNLTKGKGKRRKSWHQKNRTKTAVRLHPCTGSEIRNDDATRLGRLNAFLDDIATVGYFDKHIMPITYQLSINRAFTESSEEFQPLVFDIKSMNDVIDFIAKQETGDVLRNGDKNTNMKRKGDERQPWVIKWSELKEMASSGGDREAQLAQNAIEKMCSLYETDVRCLPYDVPECKNFSVF